MNAPTTRAGQWLLDRAHWDDGMRGFFVRINATGSPQDMHRHVLAIESEAAAAERSRYVALADKARALSGHEAGCRKLELSYGRSHKCDCGYDALMALIDAHA